MGFGSGGSHLGILFGNVSSFATEQAEVLLEMVLLLCLCELAVFSELRGEVRVGLLLVSIATASVSVTEVTGVTLSAIIIFIFISVLSGVCIFVALPFIVRAFVLVGGQILLGHLGTVLPISGVNRLGKGTEFMEGVGFSDMGNLILDVGRKSVIQYNCWRRAALPHWTQVARQLKSTRYFTMHWLLCILRFLRSGLALPSGLWGLKLFLNSLTRLE